MIFSNVDLPQPLEPITEEKLPSFSVSEMSSSATTLFREYVLPTCVS